MTECVRVEVTINSEDAAADLARSVVLARLAACAQISSPIASTYWWNGEMTTDREWYIVMKTTADRLDQLVTHVRSVHPYEVPEVVATPITGGNPDYLQWIENETRG
jgi:periplasmic divalent cation tolerance protein